MLSDSIRYARDQDSIAAEAKLDGIYVLRTSVDATSLDSGEVVSSCKALAQVERAFRAFNTDLATICLNQIQPADPALPGFRLVTTPTALQRQAFDPLGVSHRLGVA